MDWEEQIFPFIREHVIALLCAVIGLICIGYGVINLSYPQQKNDPQFPSIQPASAVNVSPTPKQITIDIEGAVQKPGVYKISVDSRIQDALAAAGGLSQNADRQQVAQNLNLASPLTDGAKLYIPAVGEQMKTSGDASSNLSGTVAGSSTVNINQASAEELDALPGIGPVTAQKIISNRPYQSAQDLLEKKVVGQSEFTKIKDEVSVY